MIIGELIKLKCLMDSPEGRLLITYINDYITAESCKNIEATEIKGMCRLAHQIKNIPSDYDNKKRRSN